MDDIRHYLITIAQDLLIDVADVSVKHRMNFFKENDLKEILCRNKY